MTNTVARKIRRLVLSIRASHHYRAGHPERASRYAAAYHRLSH